VRCLLLFSTRRTRTVFSPLPPEVGSEGVLRQDRPTRWWFTQLASIAFRRQAHHTTTESGHPAIIIVKAGAEISGAGVAGAKGLRKYHTCPLSNPISTDGRIRLSGKKLLRKTPIRDLQDATILYCRGSTGIMIDVILPDKHRHGAHMWLLEGKLAPYVEELGSQVVSISSSRPVSVCGPANRWIPAALNTDLYWTEQHPFRQAAVNFKPGEKLELRTWNWMSLIESHSGRISTGRGTQFAGRSFCGRVQWGDALWLDHQLNYHTPTDGRF